MARRSFSFLPGVKINVGKNGISSFTIGKRGASINIPINNNENTETSEQIKERHKEANKTFLRLLSYIGLLLISLMLGILISDKNPQISYIIACIIILLFIFYLLIVPLQYKEIKNKPTNQKNWRKILLFPWILGSLFFYLGAFAVEPKPESAANAICFTLATFLLYLSFANFYRFWLRKK